MNVGKKIADQVADQLTRKVSRAISNSIAKGAKETGRKAVESAKDKKASKDNQSKGQAKHGTQQTVNDTTKRPGPKRNISKEIKHHKRAFDYLVIVTEDGPCFVVDGKVKAEKAAKMYLNYRPEANAGDYELGRCRFNVTTQKYELVTDPEAKTQGTFPVHIFHMEG